MSPLGDPEQHARTLRVLELLAESWEAHERGDVDKAVRITDLADAETLIMLLGAMRIGQVPEPGGPEFAELLDTMRAGGSNVSGIVPTGPPGDEGWRDVALATREALRILGYPIGPQCLPDENPCGGTWAQHALAHFATLRAIADHQAAHLGDDLRPMYEEIRQSVAFDLDTRPHCQLGSDIPHGGWQ